MSRSVTVPTRGSFAQTGSMAMSRMRIFLAASVKEASGLMHCGSSVLMSLTFIFDLSLDGPSGWWFGRLDSPADEVPGRCPRRVCPALGCRWFRHNTVWLRGSFQPGGSLIFPDNQLSIQLSCWSVGKLSAGIDRKSV